MIELQNKLEELVFLDKNRLAALQTIHELALPDCWIAAGFVRNLVWDYLHGYSATSLNDVDVIFWDPSRKIDPADITRQLTETSAGVYWEVKNQALMHEKHGDNPYRNCREAMMHWPEKETAVGVRIVENNHLEINAPFGLESLFDGFISHNPVRSKSVFCERVRSKGWLEKWPKLKIRR